MVISSYFRSLKFSLRMRPLVLSLSLLLTLMLQAQDTKEILMKSLNTVNALEQASYRIEISQTTFMNGDTNRSSADCSLKRIPADTIAKMYYYFSTANSGFYKYNGSAFYSYAPEYYNFVLRYTVAGNPDKFRAVSTPNGVASPEVTSVVYYTLSLLKSGDEITSMLEDIKAGNSKNGTILRVISDTLSDGITCWGIRLIKPKKNFSYQKLILIDKDNYLPLAVIKDFKGGNASLNNLSVGQYSSVKYLNVKESVSRFDRLMGDKSLPKKVEVRDNMAGSEPFRIGDQAPALAIPLTSAGKLVSTDSLKGRILILAFTSTSCINSAEGNEVIRELNRKYGARKDVIIINVFSSSADTREKVEKYYKKNSIEGYTLFYSSGIENTWGIKGYPNFFLIDRHGRIAYFQRGYSNDLLRVLSSQIEDCLGRP